MKILLVSLFLPREKSRHAGGRYVFEILRDLSRRHAITLVTRVEEGEQPSIESLKPYCREIHPYPYRSTPGGRGLLGDIGVMLSYLGFTRYAARLASRGDFDLVQMEWVESALLVRRGRTPIVLDAHDVITKPAERGMRQAKGAARIPACLKYLFVRAAERRIARGVDLVLTRSEFDRDYLLALQPGVKVKTVPHPAGLDITDRIFPRRKGEILFLASYKHRKVNVDAALYFYERVFPGVRESVPDARYVIAGYGPPVALTSLAEKDPRVTVTGFVDDIDACYKQAEVFVAPILAGGGIIVKILDALAAGTPVVTTSYGNEGIGAVPGRDLLVADDPVRFGEAVVRLLRDPEYAREIAENGRKLVEKKFGLESVMKKIESAYGEVVISPPCRSPF